MVATDDEECFDLIVDEDDGLNDDYYSHLRENIMNASVFELANDDVASGIVEQFTT